MKKLFAVVAGLLMTVGCGVGQVSTGVNESDEVDDALSTSTPGFVRLQRDQRRCAAPACGGWFVTEVNKASATAQYVTALDFALSGLDDANQQKVLGAPEGELLLKGKYGSKSRTTGLRKFRVTEAYRGMPGIALTGSETFYSVTTRSPARQCFAAPCNNEVAQKLNARAGTGASDFTGLSVQSAAASYVDTTWLDHRVHQGRAVVAGAFVSGNHYAAGDEKVLDASQVFVMLPEGAGPCPTLMPMNCGATHKLNAYTRNEDRCLVPSGCVTRGVCPMYMPACPDGYTLSSWVSTGGCNSFACDPTWITE